MLDEIKNVYLENKSQTVMSPTDEITRISHEIRPYCEALFKTGEAIDQLLKQNEIMREALETIKSELGIPSKEYPAPVTNAVNVLEHTLKRCDELEEG